nr:immunoglobulin heavy chain junction region [Mus musculus]
CARKNYYGSTCWFAYW